MKCHDSYVIHFDCSIGFHSWHMFLAMSLKQCAVMVALNPKPYSLNTKP